MLEGGGDDTRKLQHHGIEEMNIRETRNQLNYGKLSTQLCEVQKVVFLENQSRGNRLK